MLPICMVNAKRLAQVPEDVRVYLRALRRRIIELEQADPEGGRAELEGGNRRLEVELDDAQALLAQQQVQIRQLQQQLADAKIASKEAEFLHRFSRKKRRVFRRGHR